MKEIRFLMKEMAAVAITSAWWAAFVFKNTLCGAIAAILSVIIIIATVEYVLKHWNDGKDKDV